MMIKAKIIGCLMAVLILLVTGRLCAGPVSLTDSEILRLRSLAASSPDAAAWAKTLEKQAQEALTLSPHPIDQIQTAGKLKGSVEKTRTEEALQDMPRIKVLGLAYALTGDENIRKKAEEYLLAWAKTCHPPDNPIDGTNLEPLLETYDLVRVPMELGNQKMIEDWFRNVAQVLLASDNPSKGTHWNNWQVHRLKIVSMAAFLLNDKDLENQSLESLKTLMERNLNPDGSTLDYLERDALHYQVYDLEPLIRTAILYERAMGLDLYDRRTSQSASVSQCVAFVLPFAKREKTHTEYVHTTVKFDLQRAQNHEKGHGIGEDFPPQGALKCLELAQYFQPGLLPLVQTLANKPIGRYPTLQILMNDVTRPFPGPAPTP